MNASLFIVALQSSLLLGLIHGVNPCGHSWLVLAPFVVGSKSGMRVTLLTASFLAGTALACLMLGVTLGLVSSFIPQSAGIYLDYIVNGVLVLLGITLIVKPELLHHHDHGHDHDHDHEHDAHVHNAHRNAHGHEHHSHDHHDHCHAHDTSCACSHSQSKLTRYGAAGLFAIGFVNMIVPCPTVAIMYSYALDSGHWLQSTQVFAAYAVGTAISVGAVIWGIFKITTLARKLEQHWIETAIMRTAGAITLIFGLWSLYQTGV